MADGSLGKISARKKMFYNTAIERKKQVTLTSVNYLFLGESLVA